MRLRRCAIVFFENRESVSVDVRSLLSGGNGLARERRWLALAAHVDGEIDVSEVEREILGDVGPGEWIDDARLEGYPKEAVKRLLSHGLLISDDEDCEHRRRDDALRCGHWWPMAALMHRHSRWQSVDSVTAMAEGEMTTAVELRTKLGAPPPAVSERGDALNRIRMPRLPEDEFDGLLAKRTTCRNFDIQRSLSQELLARMLQRALMAHAQVRVQEDTVFLKKYVPSGGGLHPVEAYLLVNRVEGLAPGLYHYHPIEHALQPLPPPEAPLDVFARLALAGQHWFADAPVMIVLVLRFSRSFWKYRLHAKAYRAVLLDIGHISQMLYVSATQLGLGAFVTSAINEADIEKALALDPMQQGVVAVCGFGWRGEKMETSEFDPRNEVWSKDG
ncbi:putative peptide maturation dehydrogenase [Xanthomonas sacchari]|uniref:putative peptide maturation dehydrogenase n=1 Tax=Xanthomonas sp. SHU 308 TaxID=1591201 RepID=UPI000476EAC3|nr:putative peptide maturation dehydrogenase [Xanthomonas sp. SHU 308]